MEDDDAYKWGSKLRFELYEAFLCILGGNTFTFAPELFYLFKKLSLLSVL